MFTEKKVGNGFWPGDGGEEVCASCAKHNNRLCRYYEKPDLAELLYTVEEDLVIQNVGLEILGHDTEG